MYLNPAETGQQVSDGMNTIERRGAALKRIEAIIRNAVEKPDLDLREGTTTRDVDGWDSLSHVGIILDVEKAFSVKLTTAEVSTLETVGSLLDIVLARGKVEA